MPAWCALCCMCCNVLSCCAQGGARAFTKLGRSCMSKKASSGGQVNARCQVWLNLACAVLTVTVCALSVASCRLPCFPACMFQLATACGTWQLHGVHVLVWPCGMIARVCISGLLNLRAPSMLTEVDRFARLSRFAADGFCLVVSVSTTCLFICSQQPVKMLTRFATLLIA